MLPVRLRRHRPISVWEQAWRPFELFDRDLGWPIGDSIGAWFGGPCLGCRVDVREDDGHVYIHADLPGLSKDDIEITLEEGVLTIRGERKQEAEHKEGDYHLHERRHGKFERSFTLPTTVDEGVSNIIDTAKIDANLTDGVLTVTLDKKEEVKPRRIEVRPG